MNADKYRPGSQPQKRVLECLTQAQQDVIENGHPYYPTNNICITDNTRVNTKYAVSIM